MKPKFVRKKKKKIQEVDEEKGARRVKAKKKFGNKLKKKKVTAPKLEIHPDVKKIVAIRGDKNKFVRELSTLLTQRAGYPVRIVYHRSLDRKFDTKVDNALPFIRIVETDTPLGDTASFLFIIISDGAFKSEQLLGRMAQGMYLRW